MLLPFVPCGPLTLSVVGHAIQYVTQGSQQYAPMRCNGQQRFKDFSLDQFSIQKKPQVCEVAPSCVGASTLQRSHQLLGNDHRFGIGENFDLRATQQGRDRRSSGGWEDGIPHVDVDAELDSCGRKLGLDRSPNARLHLLVSDRSSMDRGRQKHHAVVEVHRHDLSNKAFHRPWVVVSPQREQVYVACRTA